jgi:hypothetical protein
MARFVFPLWTRRRREIVPLPGVPLSAWLCLVALITALPFLLAGIDQQMTNAIPVSLGLLLGLVGIRVGCRVYPVLIGSRKHASIQALSSPVRAALRHALQTTRFDSALRDTTLAQAVTAYQRQAGVPGLIIGNTAEDVLREMQTAVLAVKPSGFVSPVVQ